MFVQETARWGFLLVFWLVLCTVVIIRSLPCDVITRSPSCFCSEFACWNLVTNLWSCFVPFALVNQSLSETCKRRLCPFKTSQRNQFEHVQWARISCSRSTMIWSRRAFVWIVLSGEDSFLRFFADSFPSCRQISVNLSLLPKEWQRM